jgi:hypothetical protein
VGSYTRRLASIPTPKLGAQRATVLPINGNGLMASSSVRPIAPGYSLLPNSSPGRPSMPVGARVTSEQARVRRRNVLAALAGAAALTLLPAVAFGGLAVMLHLLVDAALLGFVLLLVQYQREIDLSRTQQRPVYAAPGQAPFAATGTGPA